MDSGVIERHRGRLADVTAEADLVGALLTRPALVESLPPGFSVDVFSNENLALIYETLRTVDLVPGAMAIPVVAAALRGMDGLDAAYLSSLGASVMSYRPADVQQRARDLVQLYRWRRLRDAGQRLALDAEEVGGASMPPEPVLLRAATELEELGAAAPTRRDPVTFDVAADEALAELDATMRGTSSGVRTGLPSLDRFNGRFWPGELAIVAGRPGMGKTGLLLGLATAAARDGTPVLIVSLEMSRVQLLQRALARAARVDAEALIEGTLDDADVNRVVEARYSMRGLPIHLDDVPGQRIDLIRAQARAWKRRHGIGLLMVDYLQLAEASAEDARQGPTHAVEKIAYGLKGIAKELCIPVIAAAQLSRNVEAREDKRPILADLRQSGAIEQAADKVLFLFRPEYYLREPERAESDTDARYADKLAVFHRRQAEVAGIAEIEVAKRRNGRKGTAKVHFDGPTITFSELAHDR